MAFESLRDFIGSLERSGELETIGSEVSPFLELAALADREMKSPGGGKALLFTNVKGSTMPVLVNALGSKKRITLALGGSPEVHGERIEKLLKLAPPKGFFDALSLLPTLAPLRSALPKGFNGRPPCREVVYTGDAVDLTTLPVPLTWPDDGGPFVTFPAVFVRDPVTGRQNAGMYRLQIYDRNTAGMHWHIHKDGAAVHDEARRSGKRLEVSVAIGGDPAITYAATAPLPRGIDEMMLAGFLRGRSVAMAKCLTNDVRVPAHAEIILEGYVDPSEERIEGPFGDHTGYYSPAEPYPVFHVTAITHRKNPIYLTTVVGIPPMEDEWIGWATERLFLPLLRTQWPEVARMYLPPEGVFHNLCVATIRKTYPRQAKRLMSGFWGAGQMSFTKIVAVADEATPLDDPRIIALDILNNLRIPDGLLFTEGVLDALDHASPTPLWGGKLGIDATKPIASEPGFGEKAPPPADAPDPAAVLAKLKEQFPNIVEAHLPVPEARLKLLLLVLAKDAPGEGAALAETALRLPGVDIAVAVEGKGGEPLARLVWRALSSIDPLRDAKVFGQRVAVDATTKGPQEGHPRTWPAEVSHPKDILDKIAKLRMAGR